MTDEIYAYAALQATFNIGLEVKFSCDKDQIVQIEKIEDQYVELNEDDALTFIHP